MDPKVREPARIFECLVPAQPSHSFSAARILLSACSRLVLQPSAISRFFRRMLISSRKERTLIRSGPVPRSSSFRISGDFPEISHHTLDLIRQICVMPASKAYKLTYSRFWLCAARTATPASARGNCLRHPDLRLKSTFSMPGTESCHQNRNAELGQKLRQAVVDKRIILIRS